MREINKIILHCSDSLYGDRDLINSWHKARGFKEIGYHYLILNGYRYYSPSYKSNVYMDEDGKLQIGRAIDKAGAHCKGHNHDSIGICLIGRHTFTARQLLDVLPNLLIDLMEQFKIPSCAIFGHYEFDSQKTCPNIDMPMVRVLIDKLYKGGKI
jgi:hypothetical protein